MTARLGPVFDSLLPPEVAAKAEAIGVAKARMPAVPLLVLAVLAGAFIALGAMFSTVVAAGSAGMPFGAARLLIGIAFSLGLILVVIAGAELFTGNNLIVIAWASRRVSVVELLRNWAIVYAGNLVGAVATASLVFLSRQYTFGGGEVGLAALNTANAKAATKLGYLILA